MEPQTGGLLGGDFSLLPAQLQQPGTGPNGWDLGACLSLWVVSQVGLVHLGKAVEGCLLLASSRASESPGRAGGEGTGPDVSLEEGVTGILCM